jgi:uncharacterized protein (TIGR00266 family)
VDIAVRLGPTFGVARLTLGPNEPVRLDPAGVMAIGPGVGLSSRQDGGRFRTLRRAARGNDDASPVTLVAASTGGWVDVVPPLSGELAVLSVVPGSALFLQRTAWLANEVMVSIDPQWAGFATLFNGDGGFILRADGQGQVVMGVSGALETWTLGEGETVTVATGHMVAYDESVSMSITRLGGGGLVQNVVSGDGSMFEFTGPGRVFLQTRDPGDLRRWTTAPTGGLFGRAFGRDESRVDDRS